MARLRRRLTLRDNDQRPFLERWGLVWDRVGGFYLHRIVGPDPGKDLHNHPWSFVSFIVWGGYVDEQNTEDMATVCADAAEQWPRTCTPGAPVEHRRWSFNRMPLGYCHRIVWVKPGTLTLVLRGPTRRRWGFFLPTALGSYADWEAYDYASRRSPYWEQRR